MTGPSDAHALPELFDALTVWNNLLDMGASRLLLALDEYENIDSKIAEGVFTSDLLATIRESIQTHRNITWLFAGSHGIDELTHAPWTSYLVSARTVTVPNFTPEETRQLLTEPLKHSPLWEKDSPERPRFAPEFWGPNGIERIQQETNGWPHLVQLIAETCVDLVNEHETGEVSPEIMEEALDWAIERGDTVLSELLRGESQLGGEWDYLSAFSAASSQRPPRDPEVHRSLRRREIIREEGEAWNLAVPLMERWLKKRG
jgi:hypothetical protein